MEKQWFVLNTLTGQEAKAQKSIAARIKIERMEDYIGRCVIPSERVVEKKNGKKRTVTKRFFPGYVYITCHPGMFAVFFPQDGHAPCISFEPEIKKAIFKVKA